MSFQLVLVLPVSFYLFLLMKMISQFQSLLFNKVGKHVTWCISLRLFPRVRSSHQACCLLVCLRRCSSPRPSSLSACFWISLCWSFLPGSTGAAALHRESSSSLDPNWKAKQRVASREQREAQRSSEMFKLTRGSAGWSPRTTDRWSSAPLTSRRSRVSFSSPCC